MIEVRYQGRLGNHLFQYCFGRILAEKMGYKLKADPIPGFPATSVPVEGHDYSLSPVPPLKVATQMLGLASGGSMQKARVTSTISSRLFTLMIPACLKAASQTSLLPASEPVCDWAAFTA